MLHVRLAGLAVVLAGTALAAGQTPAPAPTQQQPTFRVQVDYVEVDVLVTDRNGNFVRDLKREDFQLLEDGKPQTITNFLTVDIPVEKAQRPLGAALPIEPDVRTNERPFDGRVYVMVIDDLHTYFARSNLVKKAARQFIERNLGANDLMAVVHTSGPSDASQDFTTNKRLLLAAVDRTFGRKLSSPTVSRTREYQRAPDMRTPDPVGDPDERERALNARVVLDALRDVAQWFGGVHGRRKTILFVSEGVDYDINDVFNNQGASTILSATRDAIAAATRANVSIYGIDPRGLTNLGDDDIEIQSYPNDASLGIGPQSMANELLLSQDSLRTLAEETGGFAALNRNDFTTAFDRIVEDNSSYYMLAYYPPATDKRDGKFHKIDVKVSRPELTVRSRQGYVAAKNRPAAPASKAGTGSPEVREALQSPLPVSGLAMRVFAAPFKGVAPNASVLVGVEMIGRTLNLAADNRVELSIVALDVQGKIRSGKSDTLTLRLSPKTKEQVERTGLRQLNRLDLPPGRYQLRFAAHDIGGGALGSVLYDLEVPDFYKNALNMSGLVLTSTSSVALPTARSDELLTGVLPGPPAAIRAFTQDDEIAVFAEVYDNQASSPHKVDITTTVTSDDANVVFKSNEERSSSDIQDKRGGYGYQGRVPLRDLKPGTYVLKVEARSRLGQGVSAKREVQFTVGATRSAGLFR